MKNTIYLVLTLLIVLQCWKQIQSKTSLGNLSGLTVKVLDNYVKAYLGIPFATPPIDDLRFREPQPAKPWGCVYNATRKSASCMQDPNSPYEEWRDRDPKDVSEDCLYLNVWVPTERQKGEKFATMVWIFGGGFRIGSTNMRIYDGAVISSIGNVIVVSLNYRLGTLGFANFGSEEAKGNMGMLDQVMALKWVYKNIEAFGGDRELITIFGESAGSVSIANHLISPLTKGLFKRAILQSGSNYVPVFTSNTSANTEMSLEFSKQLNCIGEDLIQCMRDLNASEIVSAENDFLTGRNRLMGFVPHSGYPFLSNDPFLDVDNGNFHDVDVMIGETKDEGSGILAAFRPQLAQQDNPMLNKSDARSFYRVIYDMNDETLDRLMEEYFGNIPDDDYASIALQAVKVISEGLFSCSIFHLADKLSEHKREVHHYTFNHSRIMAGTKEWMGVQHFDDVPFVFGFPFVSGHLYTPDEVEFSRKIIELWTSFAKTGKPHYKGMQEEWKPFNSKNRNSAYLNLENIRSLEVEIPENCKFWIESIDKQNSS